MLARVPASAALCFLLLQPPFSCRRNQWSTRRAPPPRRRTTSSCSGATSRPTVKTAKAMAAYTAAARLDPQSAEVRAELAGFLARQGHVEDASREARQHWRSIRRTTRRTGFSAASSPLSPSPALAATRAIARWPKRPRISSADGAATALTPTPRSTCCWRASTSRRPSLRPGDRAAAGPARPRNIPVRLTCCWPKPGAAPATSPRRRVPSNGRRGEPAPAGVAGRDVQRAAAMGQRGVGLRTRRGADPPVGRGETRWAGSAAEHPGRCGHRTGAPDARGPGSLAAPRQSHALSALTGAAAVAGPCECGSHGQARHRARPERALGTRALPRSSRTAATTSASSRRSAPPCRSSRPADPATAPGARDADAPRVRAIAARSKRRGRWKRSPGPRRLRAATTRSTLSRAGVLSARRFSEALSVLGPLRQRTRAMSGWCSSRRGRWPAPAAAARPSRRCARSSRPVR